MKNPAINKVKGKSLEKRELHCKEKLQLITILMCEVTNKKLSLSGMYFKQQIDPHDWLIEYRFFTF